MTKLIALALLLGCVPSSRAVSEPPPGLPPGTVWLCDLSEGRWCQSPRDVTTPPSEDSGSLCCYQGVCVKWTGGTCSGDLGWCSDYTVEVDPATNIPVATCHDGGGP